MGGSKSPALNTLAIKLWEWCIHRNIWVSAVHTAGKLYVDADFKSRSFSDKHEWMLNRNVFTEILTEFPELNMDLFASRLPHNLHNTAPGNQTQAVPLWMRSPLIGVNLISMHFHLSV